MQLRSVFACSHAGPRTVPTRRRPAPTSAAAAPTPRGTDTGQVGICRRLGTNATNKAEYFARRTHLANPLAYVRGAAGRTRAIAAAIRGGLDEHEDAASIDKRIRATEIAGLPLTLW